MSEVKHDFSDLVFDGIRKTINKFREQPCVFFSEMDIHSYLYHCLYSTRFEARTADGKTTSCVHKEYPTSFRYSKETMEDYGLSRKGARGHFDVVVLNPQFVKEFSNENVMNKDVEDTEIRSRNGDKFRKELLTAIELKYVVISNWSFYEQVEKNIEKLSIALKYQDFEAYNLVFCNHEYYYIDELTKLIENTESRIKSMFVASLCKNGGKDAPNPVTNGWSI